MKVTRKKLVEAKPKFTLTIESKDGTLKHTLTFNRDNMMKVGLGILEAVRDGEANVYLIAQGED